MVSDLRRLLLVPLCLCAVAWIATTYAQEADAAAAEHTDVGMTLVQVEEQVFLGILPRDLKLADGIETFDLVVDLRYPYEGVYDEISALRGIGVETKNLPASSRAPDQRTIEALQSALQAHQGEKILIHDSNGYRTAMIWAAYRVSLGWASQDALREVRPLGDHPNLEATIEHYAASVTSRPTTETVGDPPS